MPFDHKPEDLKEDVNFLDYLNGKYDGIEKTAEWASEICGVTPVEQITDNSRARSGKIFTDTMSGCSA